MKKFNKTTAIIASIATVLALGSGTAIAATVNNSNNSHMASLVNEDNNEKSSPDLESNVNESESKTENTSSNEDKFFDLDLDFDGDGIPDWLKELNPNLTDEDWELVKTLENPEEHGLEIDAVVKSPNGDFEEYIYRESDEAAAARAEREKSKKNSAEDTQPVVNGNEGESELDRLKRLNPQITDEQWEIFEMLENPEAHGLVKVGETTTEEDGTVFVEELYADAVAPLSDPIGEHIFYAFSKIYKDGDSTKSLLWKTYTNAVFSWNNFTKSATVDSESFSAVGVKCTDESFPILIGEDKDCKDNITYNFEHCGFTYYDIYLKFGSSDVRVYRTEMAVNCAGEQVIGRTVKIQ